MTEAHGIDVAVGDFVKRIAPLQMTADTADKTRVTLKIHKNLQIIVFQQFGQIQRKQSFDDDKTVFGIRYRRTEIGKHALKIEC